MYFKTLLSIALLSSSIACHMEMMKPPPRRSRFNPSTSNIDYNIMAPLSDDGSNFPCKKYEAGAPVTTYTAGETISVSLYGATYHGGGHCQISISYNDVDFVAVHTVIRNCMIATGNLFTVQLPADTPACERCTLAWSWVNAIGNREFYMNCADVKIVNTKGSAGLTGPQMTVLNLPGYPTVPEFGGGKGNDGANFYQNVKQITISPNGGTKPVRGTNPPAPAQPKTSLAPPDKTNKTSTNEKCSHGKSQCSGLTQFTTCSNGVLYTQNCAPGTSCETKGNYAYCDKMLSLSSVSPSPVTNDSDTDIVTIKSVKPLEDNNMDNDNYVVVY